MQGRGGSSVRTPLAILTVALLVGVVVAYAKSASEQPPQRYEVRIEAFAFQPETLRVAVGDTVVWTNHDVVPHTATSAAGKWDSGSLPKDGSWKLVPRARGEFTYDCTLHPAMTGSIVVQ